MDPYDALIEQLRSARERRQQALNGQLTGPREPHGGDLRASRRAVGADEEAFPLEQVESSLLTLRDAAVEAAAVPPPAVTLGVLRSLDAAQTQSELLHSLLSELTNHAARAVVLVFRPGGVSAWSAIGFDDVSRLGRWSCAREDSPLFADLEDNPRPLELIPGDDDVIRGWLEGETSPLEALLVPISLRGRTMGAVYADRLASAPWNPEAVQVLVAVACWMIDTLKYRSGQAVADARRDHRRTARRRAGGRDRGGRRGAGADLVGTRRDRGRAGVRPVGDDLGRRRRPTPTAAPEYEFEVVPVPEPAREVADRPQPDLPQPARSPTPSSSRWSVGSGRCHRRCNR